MKASHEWEIRARCAEPDFRPYIDSLWFGVTVKDRAYAAKICRGCPVRLDCLNDAEERRERAGVWGGKDFDPKSAVRDVAAA